MSSNTSFDANLPKKTSNIVDSVSNGIESAAKNKPELNRISKPNKIKIICIALILIYLGSKLFNTSYTVSKAVGFSLVVLNTGVIINIVLRYLLSSELFYAYRSVARII
jgi:hypothetical protein